MSRLSRALAMNVDDPAINGRWFLNLPDHFANSEQFFVEAVSPSFPKFQAQPRFGGGKSKYYPGTVDLDGLTVVLYETQGHKALRYLNRWRREVFDPENGTYGLPSEYKKNLIIEYFPLNHDNPVLTARYEGCWPTDQQPYELSYDQFDNRITINAQFSVDSLVFE